METVDNLSYLVIQNARSVSLSEEFVSKLYFSLRWLPMTAVRSGAVIVLSLVYCWLLLPL